MEEDIAQEGNANKGKALRWCLRNREEDGGREKERYTRTNERGGTRREEVENEDRERLRRQGGKVRRRQGGARRVRLKEGRSTRMVSRRSLAVWSPYSAQTTTNTP